MSYVEKLTKQYQKYFFRDTYYQAFLYNMRHNRPCTPQFQDEYVCEYLNIRKKIDTYKRIKRLMRNRGLRND